jgi:hypothetical protein
VPLFTGRGYDWTDRYLAIAGVAAKLRARSFTFDGEAGFAGPMAWPSSTHSGAPAGDTVKLPHALSTPLGEPAAEPFRLMNLSVTTQVVLDSSRKQGFGEV